MFILTSDMGFLLFGLVAAILAPFAYVPLSRGIDIPTDVYRLPMEKKYVYQGVSTLILSLMYLGGLLSLIIPVLEGEKIAVVLLFIMIIWVVNLRASYIFKSD